MPILDWLRKPKTKIPNAKVRSIGMYIGKRISLTCFSCKNKHKFIVTEHQGADHWLTHTEECPTSSHVMMKVNDVGVQSWKVSISLARTSGKYIRNNTEDSLDEALAWFRKGVHPPHERKVMESFKAGYLEG